MCLNIHIYLIYKISNHKLRRSNLEVLLLANFENLKNFIKLKIDDFFFIKSSFLIKFRLMF